MSDAGLPRCEKCEQPEYDCQCGPRVEEPGDQLTRCAECGCELDEEALETGKETCFECDYCDSFS
jgi:hypothetical protein